MPLLWAVGQKWSAPSTTTAQVSELTIDWWPLASTLFLALLSSSLLTAVIVQWLDRRHVVHDSAQDRAQSVLAALEPLRHAFQSYESSQRTSPRISDELRDLELAKKSNALFIAVAGTTDKSILSLALGYTKVGERFASGDPDTTRELEEEQFFALLAAITQFVKKNK